MKKYLAVLLCAIMVLSLMACGNSESATIEATEAMSTESKELSYEEAVDMLNEVGADFVFNVDYSNFSSDSLVVLFAINVTGVHSSDACAGLKNAIANIPKCIKNETYVGVLQPMGDDRAELSLGIREFDKEQRRKFIYYMGCGVQLSDAYGSHNTMVGSLKLLSDIEKNTSARPILIVITDGFMMRGEASLDEVVPAMTAIGIPTHVIVYDTCKENPNELDELEKIATMTGGQYVESSTESIDDDIQNLLRAVLY